MTSVPVWLLRGASTEQCRSEGEIIMIHEERDLAHERDMEMLRREQLAADCGGDMADPDEELLPFDLFDTGWLDEPGNGDPYEYYED